MKKTIYNEVTAEIKMNIDQIKAANNPLAELIRMRQATGYTGILSSKIQESAKLDRMEELVDDMNEFSVESCHTDNVIEDFKYLQTAGEGN